MRADGTGGHDLAIPGAGAYPSTSPDGASLLFTDGAEQTLSLYRFVDGSTQTMPTTGAGCCNGVTGGSLSFDGKRLVYLDGREDILTVDVSGAPAPRLLFQQPGPLGGLIRPVLAADSRTVLFAAPYEVRSVSVDGGPVRTLLTTDTKAVPGLANPTLSPDLSQLAAIVSCVGENPALRVWSLAALPAACSSGRAVANDLDRVAYSVPAWGPTGLIAYTHAGDILFVDQNGGAVTNLTASLTHGKGDATYPTWVSGCVKLP